MKTLLYRVMTSSLAIATLIICAEFGEETANAATAGGPAVTNATPAPPLGDSDNSTTPATPLEAQPTDPDPADAGAEDIPDNSKPPRIVDNAVVPEDLKVSPGLEEIIKLVQAGVSEEVIMTYVTNSTNFFNVGSDQIVYLNDLGVSTTLVTALIQHDSSSEMAHRRKAPETAKPLPRELALTTPATNVYPGAPTQEVANLPPMPLPPGSEESAPPPHSNLRPGAGECVVFLQLVGSLWNLGGSGWLWIVLATDGCGREFVLASVL